MTFIFSRIGPVTWNALLDSINPLVDNPAEYIPKKAVL